MTRLEAGFIRQGHAKATVSARCNHDSLWVEVRRHHGKHGKRWRMTPDLARELAGLLRKAADKADGMGVS